MISCTPKTKEAYQLLHNGILALSAAERQGMCVDVEYCHDISDHLERQVKYLEKRLMKSEFITDWRRAFGTSFNHGSGAQLAVMLYSPEYLNIEPIKYTDSKCPKCRGKGCGFCHGRGENPSVDEEALQATGVPEIEDLLRIRELKKAKDTYIGNFLKEQVDGVLHPNFNLHITRTYRPSTDSPNLANIPNRNPEIKQIVKRALKARPGHKLVCADFKGIEVSLAYEYHKDPEMKKYLLDKTTDMHRDMSERLFLLDMKHLEEESKKAYKAIRHSGKNRYVFPEFYGDWWKSCAGQLWADAHLQTHHIPTGSLVNHLASKGIKNLSQYEKHVESVEKWMWEEKWSVYTQWKKDWVKAYHEKGYFESKMGFMYQGVMDRKQAINYPIQGTAFHCMLQCIIWMHQESVRENWDSRICNQIYDDLMIDVHPDEESMVIERLRYYMKEKLQQHFSWMELPLDVEIEATPIDGSWYYKSEKHVMA